MYVDLKNNEIHIAQLYHIMITRSNVTLLLMSVYDWAKHNVHLL